MGRGGEEEHRTETATIRVKNEMKIGSSR